MSSPVVGFRHPRDRSGPDWWRSAVIYQIYIRSFADGNGDGIGDISGIRSRLGYLAELGVDAVWITPWYTSPMADGGYDVADFRQISEEFGTLSDAEELIADCHRHGLAIILDIVPNHTSDRHAWFLAAVAGETDPDGVPYRDRYLIRPGRGDRGEQPPNDWQSVFGGPAWTRLPDGDWYLHMFAPEQPDLNWEHKGVRTDFADILRFWFDRGVDGFRIDVAHGLVKDPALPDIGTTERLLQLTAGEHPAWDRDGVHEIYVDWRAIADTYEPKRIFVAEAWVKQTADRLARYLRPDELHSAFNFDFLRLDWDAAELRATIESSIASLARVGAPPTWVLSNHDVNRHLTRYGSPARARAAALLMLALPGGAYIYQGEELGLPQVDDLPEEVLADPVWERSGHTRRGRDGCRVPLPWTPEPPALGFGDADPWLPQPADFKRLSVAAQDGVAGSMLELYRTALSIRRAEPGLGDGDLTWVDDLTSPEAAVLAFDRGPGLRCVVNFGPGDIRTSAREALVPSSDAVEVSPTGEIRLPPDTAVWLRP